jgi:hypothetical protein
VVQLLVQTVDLVAAAQLQVDPADFQLLQGKEVMVVVDLLQYLLRRLLAAAVVELVALVEQEFIQMVQVVLEELDYQHFKVTLEYQHLMEHLDQHLEDILQAEAVELPPLMALAVRAAVEPVVVLPGVLEQ